MIHTRKRIDARHPKPTVSCRMPRICSVLAPKTRDWSQTSPANSLRFRAGSRCAKGGYRTTNEEKCYADTNRRIFMTADGVGGTYGGATASSLAIKLIPAALETVVMQDNVDEAQMQKAFVDAFDQVRSAMRRFARRHPMHAHMATTLAITVVIDDIAYMTSIGDCRVYLVRDGKLRQVTKDQTLVQAFVDANVMTPEQARKSVRRNIVTNLISAQPLDAPPVMNSIQLQTGDRLLVTTDGITDTLPPATIEELASGGSPQEIADALVLEALRQDSHDNVACVVAKALPSRLPQTV